MRLRLRYISVRECEKLTGGLRRAALCFPLTTVLDGGVENVFQFLG